MNRAKSAVAAWPHSDEHLQKYAHRPEFDASVRLESFTSLCSSSRIKISDDDPIDFYITAAHCLSENLSSLIFDGVSQEIDFVIHPQLDLAILTTGEQSNQPKYPLYLADLNDLIDKTVTHVGFGMSMLDSANSFQRQAFDSTIGSTRSSLLPIREDYLKLIREWKNNKDIYSTWFTSDWTKTLEDNPIGIGTPGDSGGSLLVKEKDEYKLVGAMLGSLDLDNLCQKLIGYKCGLPSWNKWTGIDLDFIENAKKKLLAKKAVYVYPSQPKVDFPTITFLLSNRNNFNQQCSLEMKEQYLIGYAFRNAELIVLVDEEALLNIPIELGHTHFICQVAWKTYIIEVAVEQAADDKGFLVKGTAFTEEKDRCVSPNLANDPMRGINEHRNGILCIAKIKPIYYSFSKLDLPLEVSLRSYLPNNDFIDANLLENKKILGYAGDNYDIIISLNGRELKTLNSKEIVRSTNSFEFHYTGNTYGLYFQREFRGFNKSYINLNVKKLSENLCYDSIETMTATIENFIPIDINPSYIIASNMMWTKIELIKGATLYDGYKKKTSCYAKKGSQIRLTIDDQFVNSLSLDKVGCYRVTYKEAGILYVIEVNIQKLSDPKEHYSVNWTLKQFDEELVPANESCKSETLGNLVEYSLTDSSKVIASDLNLNIVLDRIFQQNPLPKGCIGYGNENSIVRIFSDSGELGQFMLFAPAFPSSFEFEKNGKSYSISSKTVFEGDRWRILLDVHEIQQGWSFTTLMNWFK